MGGMNLGPSPVGMGNAMGGMAGMAGMAGMGGQNNHLGGLGQMGGLGRSDNMGGMTMDNTAGLLANPVLSGYAPGLQGGYQGGYQGGFQGGLPMGMGECVCMHDVA